MLQRVQRNEVLERVQRIGLDPLDFEWLGDVPGRNIVDGMAFLPLQGAYFRFVFANEWGYDFVPGSGVPQESGWAAHWSVEIGAVDRWLAVCRAEVEAPDLWEALQRDRDALVRPVGDEAANEPFRADELETIVREMDGLKEYVRGAFELSHDQLREIDAKLDYLAHAAARAPGRIDWWNQAVGAIINLALTTAVQPHVAQALLSMAAHSLGHLFGGGPPQLTA